MMKGFSKIDPVEAERLLVIVNREGADYTMWRKDLWEDMTVKGLSRKAMKAVGSKTTKGKK